MMVAPNEKSAPDPNLADKDPTFATPTLVVGYGPYRGVTGTESRKAYRISDAVESLFRRDAKLQNPEIILRRLRDHWKSLYAPLCKKLIQILGLSPAHKLGLAKGGITIEGPQVGNATPLDAIADGYRATFAWLCDLVGWAMLAGTIDAKTGDIRGLVLIDEIEQHLHPSAQMDLLKRIGKVFPRLQIIATTHSPIVALKADPAGLFALKRTSRHKVELLPQVQGLTHYTAQDVLEDERLFDTAAERDELDRDIKNYQRLASIPPEKLTDEEVRSLKELAKTLRQAGRPAETSPASINIDLLRKTLGL